MKKTLLLGLFVLISVMANSQIVINELDTDTPSVDDQEFIELKSTTPNFPLDGYVVVLFNGSSSGGDSSYFTIDLTGFTTDINGLLLIGSNGVSPVPQLLIAAGVIQNGADAIGVYQGSPNDFPDGTLATTDNLVDALVYGTGDPDDTGLMALLGETVQYDEDENGNKTSESIQRNDDGSYFVGSPTPRQLNDGSGIILNGITASFDETQYNEGDTMQLTFTTEENVNEDLNIDFSLANGNFNDTDFTGATQTTIPTGENTVTVSINLVDDNEDEGDEILRMHIASVPQEYLLLNNNIERRIVDNDFQVAPWGTPLNPTYGQVESTQPSGYYNSLDEKSGDDLRQALQDIIANPEVVRTQTYADIVTILKEADQNPANSNEVWLVYTEQGRAKLDYQTSSDNTGTWNREHVYPRSRGGFYSIEGDDIADGPDVYWQTSADSTRQGNSDAHALRAVDGPENSSRNNQNYGPEAYDGPTGNQGSFKGDVARSIFYMTIRYNGLSVENGYPDESLVGHFGDLETLLDWARNDPPDDYEMNRNNVVYTWQHNRNPFIDQPELMEYIWGNHAGEVWQQELSTKNNTLAEVKVFPNPSQGTVSVVGISGKSEVTIYSALGRKVFSTEKTGNFSLHLNLSQGMYFMHIHTKGREQVKKVIIE